MKSKDLFILKMTLPRFNELVKSIIKKDEHFVFWSSFLFYFFLYLNPNNKTLVLFFAFFILLLFTKFNDLRKALFWGFVASLPFIVGKTYFFNLIPPNKLYLPANPTGYNLVFVITVGNVIAIFMLFLLLKEWIISKKKIFRLNSALFFLFGLILIVLFSSFKSRNPGLSFLLLLQFLQGPLIFIYSISFIRWQERDRRLFLFLLMSQIIFESSLVFLQFINQGPLGRSIESYSGIVPFGGADEDVYRYRPTGTFYHANYVAAFLLPRLILNFSAFYKEKIQKNASLFLTAFIFGLLALAITLSRSAWISFFLGVLVFAFILEKKYRYSIIQFYKKRLVIILVFMLAISSYFVIPRVMSTAHTFVSGGSFVTRVELTRESFEIIRQNFFLGTGLGMSIPMMFENNPRGIMYYFPTTVHSWYLLFTAEAGIFALLFFLFLVNSSLRKVFTAQKRNIFIGGVFVAVLSMLVNGFMQPFLGEMGLLFIFLGILTVCGKS